MRCLYKKASHFLMLLYTYTKGVSCVNKYIIPIFYFVLRSSEKGGESVRRGRKSWERG